MPLVKSPEGRSCSHKRLKCSWGSLRGSSRAEQFEACRAAAAEDLGTGEKAAGDRLPLGRRMLPLIGPTHTSHT